MTNVLQLLSDVLRHNIISPNAYHTRFIGFKSEFYFSDFLQARGTETLKGGFLIPVQRNYPCYQNFIYYTVLNSSDNLNNYVGLYQSLARLDHVSMAVIKCQDSNIDGWQKHVFCNAYFPVPLLQYYKFEEDRFTLVDETVLPLLCHFHKTNEMVTCKVVDEQLITNALSQLRFVPTGKLIDLYVSRLIFDVILGQNIVKGVPSDIDFIVKSAVGNMFVEVKEKDLAKTIKGFGLDQHRIDGMMQIQQRTGIKYHLVVRHVNNQTQRIFIQWLIISIDHFVKNMHKDAVEGGHGMRSINSHNPTCICDIRYFSKLD